MNIIDKWVLIGGFQDTRTNKEDFAITPYLFGVWVQGKYVKVRGLGLCFGYYALFIGFAFNIPVKYPRFSMRLYKKNN